MTSSRGLPIDPEGASQVHHKLELSSFSHNSLSLNVLCPCHGIDIRHVCPCGGG